MSDDSPGDWTDLARKLDWTFTYASERDVYPEVASGRPWLPGEAWRGWDEPYRTTYTDYVRGQSDKNAAVYAVRDAIRPAQQLASLPVGWVDGLKLHAATLPLAEFAAVVGNLRAARFGRDAAWRSTALLGALDEMRHTEIPLLLMHELIPVDRQFDWTHKLYHTDNWVAIAARHMIDELLLAADPIELAVATNFVFETGFTNLQFIGLASLAREAGDHAFETMITSIQTDEARHSQIGPAVLQELVKHDRAYAQRLLDKWFWRSARLFAVVTGFVMDYLTPLEHRTGSFKEFMNEWVIDQFLASLPRFGLEKPWYWDEFLASLDQYHHMMYASAYTYRSTVWFNFVIPGPDERAWLREKYPASWNALEPIWMRIAAAWERTDPGVDLAVHGTAIITFCDMCQLPLCGGSPQRNSATTHTHAGRRYIFCSTPCRSLFENEPERYAEHKDIVKRVLAGEAPGNVLELITRRFGLDFQTWGKDARRGVYPWMSREGRPPQTTATATP